MQSSQTKHMTGVYALLTWEWGAIAPSCRSLEFLWYILGKYIETGNCLYIHLYNISLLN